MSHDRHGVSNHRQCGYFLTAYSGLELTKYVNALQCSILWGNLTSQRVCNAESFSML